MIWKKSSIYPIIIILILSMIIIVIGCAQGEGTTHYVDASGNNEFNKIQDAITNATDGDTIRIFKGTYHEDIKIDKSLNVIGNGSKWTIINGSQNNETTSEYVVNITVDRVNISHLMINGSGLEKVAGIRIMSNNTYIEYVNSSNHKYGIVIEGEGNTISHCNIWNNQLGIHNQANRTTISNNNCSGNYYGIYIYTNQFLEEVNISNNSFKKNDIGMYLYKTRKFSILNNNASDCRNTGIVMHYSHNTTINENDYSHSGSIGLILSNSDTNEIFNNMCINSSYYGIYLISSKNNIITNNTYQANNNIAIYLQTSNYNQIYSNIISHNNFGIILTGSNNNSIHNNSIIDNIIGIDIRYFSENNTLIYNSIAGNLEFGIYALNNSGIFVNAEKNWWGKVTGPFHTTRNPEGEGNEVSDNITFHRWNGYSLIESITPNPAYFGENISFHGISFMWDEIIYNSWESSINGEFYNGTLQEISYSNFSAGNHTISFRVKDDRGLFSQVSRYTLLIRMKPLAVITNISKDIAPEGENIHFSGIGYYGNISIYLWRSSLDGIFYNGTSQEFDHSNLSNGTHTIFFLVMNDDGVWSQEAFQTLIINGRPVATIHSLTPNPALDVDTIHFQARYTDDGTIMKYSWQSSQNETLYNGTESNFTYTGLANGSHMISLAIMDEYGFWSRIVNTSLQINGKPVAKILSITPSFPGYKDIIHFVGNGSDDGNILKYQWHSNINGVISYEMSFKISHLSIGNHTISFRIQDSDGAWSDDVNTSLRIIDYPQGEILSISPFIATNGQIIQFIGHGKGKIIRYSWWSSQDGEFYNGSQSDVEYNSLSNGSHEIILRVMNDKGLWSSPIGTTLYINGIPFVRIESILPNPANNNEVVRFNAIGSDDGTIIRYVWESSLDGILYNGSNNFIYRANLAIGTHLISLIALDDLGQCSNLVTSIIQVVQYTSPNEKPCVIITTPLNNSVVSGRVIFKGKASDIDGSIQRVEISIKGGPWMSVVGNEIWNFQWHSSDVTNGNISIRVRAFDGREYSDETDWEIIVRNRENDKGSDFNEILGITLVAMVFIFIGSLFLPWNKILKFK